ncbi:MAG: hypothetical protein R3D67_07685 [Hyphomicrobiaceae bacterium]
MPDTVQLIEPPGLTVVGGVGVQDVERPGGSPLTAHVAFVAATNGLTAAEQLKLPV